MISSSCALDAVFRPFNMKNSPFIICMAIKCVRN